MERLGGGLDRLGPITRSMAKHKFYFTNSIVFKFWYLAVFVSSFQNRLFHIFCAGCFVPEKYFHS